MNPHSATSWLQDFGGSDRACQSIRLFPCETRVPAEPASQRCVRVASDHPGTELSVLLGPRQALNQHSGEYLHLLPEAIIQLPGFQSAGPTPGPTSSYSYGSVQNPGSTPPSQPLSTPSGTSPWDLPLSPVSPSGSVLSGKPGCKQACQGNANKPCETLLIQKGFSST